MKIDIISVQPRMFDGFLNESMVARAQKKGACDLRIVDLRDFGLGKWKKTDDAPYGGGPGMLMRCEPWFAAVEHCLECETLGGEKRWRGTAELPSSTRIIMTTPKGKKFTQRDAEMFAGVTIPPLHHSTPPPLHPSTPPPFHHSTPPPLHLIFLCGHYEGFDARIETLATDFYSLGDFVMTGGELAAAAMTDAIVRLLPGVLGGGPAATSNESFSLVDLDLGSRPLLEPPQYTHPPVFRGMAVPEVLLSGDHAKIERWRRAQAEEITKRLRPDLQSDNIQSSP